MLGTGIPICKFQLFHKLKFYHVSITMVISIHQLLGNHLFYLLKRRKNLNQNNLLAQEAKMMKTVKKKE